MSVVDCVICPEPICIPQGKTTSDFKKNNLTFVDNDTLSNPLQPVVTKCDHVFHQSCLKAWIDTFSAKSVPASCPTCRSNLTLPAVIVPRVNTQRPVSAGVSSYPNGIYHQYRPVWTELKGVGVIVYGSLTLALGGATKVHDFMTQRRTIIPYITDDAGTFWMSVGTSAMKDGCKKLAPALCVILTTFVLSRYASRS